MSHEQVVRLAAAMTRAAFVAVARVLTSVRGEWWDCEAAARPRVYFANHASHADFVLIWSAVPAAMRRSLRPVAAADYWTRGSMRCFVIENVFRAVLVERHGRGARRDAIERMTRALDHDALVLFPEGTRNTTDEALLPFRRGIYELAAARPNVELVPVWLDNAARVLPKGAFLPVPLLCRVTFGPPIRLRAQETERAFLERARAALLALAPAARPAPVR